MKKRITFLMCCLLAVLATTTQAQNKCCSGLTVIPELTPGLHSTHIPLDKNTPAISLAVNPSNDLPNVGYIITKRGTPALDEWGNIDTTGGGGDVIIGADDDGIFRPMEKNNYGVSLAIGDTFDLTAIGYDLALIRNLADSLLNGFAPGSGPCCSLLTVMSIAYNEPALSGFCDSMHHAGIYSSNDIHGIEEVITFLAIVYDGIRASSSVPSLITSLQMLNANGAFISTDCGGIGANNFVPYGINKNLKYGYITAPLASTAVVYQDFNQNCVQTAFETGLANRTLVINPGNILLQSNNDGYCFIDTLPVGNYTITADTSFPNWQLTCPVSQSFTVTSPGNISSTPSFGYISNYLCTAPNVSINAPFLRPGFSNQRVYVQACNNSNASAILNNAYTIIELDPHLIVQSGSSAYTSLGNNQYQFNLGDLYPGQCVNLWLACSLSTSAVLNSTLCMNAQLYPVDSCALDSIPNPYLGTALGTVTPCTLPWDYSSLSVDVSCMNDSVRFVIYNTGVLGGGNMDCLAPVRAYLDGQHIFLDSIQLQGGDSIVYMFAGNGQTWRLEADQHPLHPGNSHPNATIENCGTGIWTPNLVNALPLDDADPIIDIYCGLVTGSYDPNDKTGFPLGLGSNYDIEPNQDIEYLIRFQNTGTDTAFNIVIRDTLSMDFNIFSVQSGASSNDYSFRIYGPRVLEWTFNNIMLPDSNVNEPNSHGFIKFKVKQNPNLPDGTVLENSAAIYFDFNAPIFTNTSWHTINRNFIYLNTEKQVVVNKKEIKIYPNPTTGIINIDQGDNQEISILVLDNLGRVVLQKQSNEMISSLNINYLPTGIYYVSINNGRELVTKKVVKQ